MAAGKKKASGTTATRHLCDICDKTFKYKRDLNKHLCNHVSTVPKPTFQCKICNRPFHSKQFLKVHSRVHTGEKPYHCATCGNSYRFAHGLRNHLSVHTGEKPFVCLQCGKAFAQRTFLTIHLRTHTDERPYACKTCGKAFHQRSHLRYHLLTHSSKSDHKCPICGKKLRYKQSLQLHLRIHNQEKPFSCEVCGKSFYEKPKLTIHRRVHTGEKPYVCTICGRGFAQKGNCDKHKERYHARDAERRFQCDSCPKAFIWKKCLDMHLQWHELEKKKKKKISKRRANKKSSGMSHASDGIIISDGLSLESVDSDVQTNNGDTSVHSDVDDGNYKILTSWQDGQWIDRKVKQDEPCKLSLKENMSELLPRLLDDEVLLEIGWPNMPIEEMVTQVLKWCDQQPIVATEVNLTEDEAFLQNVQLLLNIVLEEKFTEVNGVQQKSPNEIIVELLNFSKIH